MDYSSNQKNHALFGQTRRWLTNERPEFPELYTSSSTYYENMFPVLEEEQTLPVPVRLVRADVGVNNDDDDQNPILPGFWWILGYMGLTALTAIGIRQSLK